MAVTTKKRSRLSCFHPEYHTQLRTRAFEKWKNRPAGESIKAFCRRFKDDPDVPSRNAFKLWLNTEEAREEEGKESPCRRKKRLEKPGPKTPQAALNQVEVMAHSPKPLRLRNYNYYCRQAGRSYRTLRRLMKVRDPPVIRSERRPIFKVSKTNKQLRIQYGTTYRSVNKTQ